LLLSRWRQTVAKEYKRPLEEDNKLLPDTEKGNSALILQPQGKTTINNMNEFGKESMHPYERIV
jgi:hypothetical protein